MSVVCHDHIWLFIVSPDMGTTDTYRTDRDVVALHISISNCGQVLHLYIISSCLVAIGLSEH